MNWAWVATVNWTAVGVGMFAFGAVTFATSIVWHLTRHPATNGHRREIEEGHLER